MTIFTTTNYHVSSLISYIFHGDIGLPDLQRPFVWNNVQVRNLFDSLYKGYPAGFLVFWETGANGKLRVIGEENNDNNNKSAKAAKLAIVDGQQRLTALYAVIKGMKVIRKNFKPERIYIAFNPYTERFAVRNDLIKKDKSFIPDISELWSSDTNAISTANDFLRQLSAVREVSDVEEKKIQEAIGKLHGLTGEYNFTALTLPAEVDIAVVADVFVRINSEGKTLNQADFIMTLLSIYWDQGRADLEAFANEAITPSDDQSSPYNNFIKPSPDQLLRATIGLSLKRARFEYVYNALRGRDVNTSIDNAEKRDEQFQKMQIGQLAVLDLTNWHHFLGALTLAGYRGEKMISSKTAIIYSYVLYLVGIVDYKIDRQSMRQAIAEFFFMVALTSRYTNSSETQFDADLAIVGEATNGEAYLAKLQEICMTTLTPDFWGITLPSRLASSGTKSPSLFAYYASLIKLNANVLYGSLMISNLIDPTVRGPRAAIERHHLFPRGYMEEQGVRDNKKINQIANYALVEWPDNVRIGNRAPSVYVPPLDADLSVEQREQLYFWHALPHHWWKLPYEEFLVSRRERMARVVEAAWKRLSGS